MGNYCSATAVEETVDKTEEEVLEMAGAAVAQMATQAAEQAKVAAVGIEEQAIEKLKEGSGIACTTIDAAAEQAKVVVVAKEQQAAEKLKEGTEAVCATIDAAAAAVTDAMVVEFVAEKGASRSAQFKTRETGMTLALAGGGCCGPTGVARVAVKKVEEGGQAKMLGVKRSWVVKSINGVEVTGLEHARKLLAEHAEKLPVS